MEELKILGETYKIVKKEVIDNNENLLGQIDHMNNVIYLKSNMSKDKEKVTLIHEILHGIFCQLGFNDEHDNEHLIDALASSIYQVFSENEILKDKKLDAATPSLDVNEITEKMAREVAKETIRHTIANDDKFQEYLEQ